MDPLIFISGVLTGSLITFILFKASNASKKKDQLNSLFPICGLSLFHELDRMILQTRISIERYKKENHKTLDSIEAMLSIESLSSKEISATHILAEVCEQMIIISPEDSQVVIELPSYMLTSEYYLYNQEIPFCSLELRKLGKLIKVDVPENNKIANF